MGLPAGARAGVAVADGVLGVGLLLLPPVVAATAGRTAPAAWAVQCVAAAAVGAALASCALARPGAGIARTAERAAGPAAGRAVVAVYLGGFVVGQVALATAAGRFLASAVGGGLAVAGVAAAAVLGAACRAAAAGWVLPPPLRRARLAVTVVLAAAGCAWPALLAGGGLFEPRGHGFLAGAFLVLLAMVGWERAGERPADGGVVVAVAAGVVTATTVGLAVLLDARLGTADAPGAGSFAVAAALTVASYCPGNVHAAVGFLHELRPRPRPVTVLTVASMLGAVLAVALWRRWPVAALLAGPGAATVAVYAAGMAVAVLAGGRAARAVGVAVLCWLAVLATAAGPVLLLPAGAAVLGAVTVRRSRRPGAAADSAPTLLG